MNNDNNIKQSLIILDKIENIRAKNNKNWMDIVRLSIKLDYKKTSKLIKEIYKYDTQISALAKKIFKK